MNRKPMKIEQMKPFLMQNANDLTLKHGPNNVSNNFIDIANYIDQQEKINNELKAKLQAVNNICSDLGSLRDIVDKIKHMTEDSK